MSLNNSEKNAKARKTVKKTVKKYNHTFDPEKVKDYNQVYSADSFWQVLHKNLILEDYSYDRQKIKPEEFAYIAYVVTKYIIKSKERVCKIPRNYFLSEKHSSSIKNKYHKYSKRRLNKGKLAYLIKVLNKYDIVNVKHAYMNVNEFNLGTNNPYYRFVK